VADCYRLARRRPGKLGRRTSTVMQTVGKTHKSGCRLHTDVEEERDPGLTELVIVI